jgi:outer membrane protein assembly factor BamB
MPRSRRQISVSAVIGLVSIIVVAVLFGVLPDGETEARATATRTPVDLAFRTVDGDKALHGSGAMRGVKLIVRDQTGAVVAQTTSDSGGLAHIFGVSSDATLTVTATPPAKYVAFPLTCTVTSIAAGQVVEVPLYRNDQQWQAWGKTNDHRRVGPSAGKPKGNPIWTIDPGNNMEFPPSLAYGLVVYGSYHGFLCANDQATGAPLWTVYPGYAHGRISKFANQVAVSSWVENGARVARVFYADLTGIVGCRDLFTGTLIWERVSGRGTGTAGKTLPFRSIEASPLVQGETLYVSSRYNNGGSKAGVWALSRRTGAVRWFRKLARNSRSKIGSSPAYAAGRLFVATYDGYIYGLRAANGKVLWRRYVGGQFYGTPAVSGSRLFIGNKSNGRVYCLSTTSGRLLWRTGRLGTSVHSSPAVYGGRVYLGAGKRFYALNAKNGRVAWRKAAKKRIYGSASVLRGVVYYSDYGATYGRSARTGSLVWTKRVGRYSPVTATRHLIVLCGRQTIYGYQPSK